MSSGIDIGQNIQQVQPDLVVPSSIYQMSQTYQNALQQSLINRLRCGEMLSYSQPDGTAIQVEVVETATRQFIGAGVVKPDGDRTDCSEYAMKDDSQRAYARAIKDYGILKQEFGQQQQRLIDRLKAGEVLNYVTTSGSRVGLEYSAEPVPELFVVKAVKDDSAAQGWRSLREESYLIDTEVPEGAFIQAFHDFGILNLELSNKQKQQREVSSQSQVHSGVVASPLPFVEGVQQGQPEPNQPNPKPFIEDKQTMPQATQEQAAQETGQQERQKTANISFFKGGANVFGPAANLLAASISSVELKQTQKNTAYVKLDGSQIAQAIAIAKSKGYEIVRQARQPKEEWEHASQAEAEAVQEAPSQEAPQSEGEVKAPRDLDLETVIKSNIAIALRSPDSDLLKNDVVTANAEMGSVRIDKGGKQEEGKGKMIFGVTRTGDIYAARKDMAVENGKLQMAEGENTRPAMIYQVSKEGVVKVNRMAEANQLLPANRQMDFSNVAKAIRDNSQSISQQATSKAASVKKRSQSER
jgi:hypothetical protein